MSYTENEYDEFVKRVEEACPSMFTQPYGGFAVGAGWWPILETLCNVIHNRVESSNKRRADAIKYNDMIDDCKHGDYRLFNEMFQSFSKPFIERRMDEIIHELPREVPDAVPAVTVEQIKEKFGGLRFYYQGGDEFIHGAVWFAESLCSKTCEVCGTPGTTRGGGWVRTLCDVHEAERNAQIEEQCRKDGLEL